MRTSVSRLAGVVILIGAVFGLIFSLYGLFALWAAKPGITAGLRDIVSLASRTLDATDQMIGTVNTSLEQADQDLQLMQTILTDTADTFGQSTSMIDDTADLMGGSMVEFVQNTQTALTSTQSTAQLIDDTLGTLSRIPLIGPSLGSRYAPEVPLNESIKQVKTSLDPLPNSFLNIQRDLQTASASMDTIQEDLKSLSTQVADIQTSIQDAKKEVGTYQLILADTRDRLDVIEARLPVALNTTFLGITALLIWILVSQAGALLNSLDQFMKR